MESVYQAKCQQYLNVHPTGVHGLSVSQLHPLELPRHGLGGPPLLAPAVVVLGRAAEGELHIDIFIIIIFFTYGYIIMLPAR